MAVVIPGQRDLLAQLKTLDEGKYTGSYALRVRDEGRDQREPRTASNWREIWSSVPREVSEQDKKREEERKAGLTPDEVKREVTEKAKASAEEGADAATAGRSAAADKLAAPRKAAGNPPQVRKPLADTSGRTGENSVRRKRGDDHGNRSVKRLHAKSDGVCASAGCRRGGSGIDPGPAGADTGGPVRKCGRSIRAGARTFVCFRPGEPTAGGAHSGSENSRRGGPNSFRTSAAFIRRVKAAGPVVVGGALHSQRGTTQRGTTEWIATWSPKF